MLKTKEFTFVSDCFQHKNNAVFGVFLQRLYMYKATFNASKTTAYIFATNIIITNANQGLKLFVFQAESLI